MMGKTEVNTSTDEFLDDQAYDSDTNEPVEESPGTNSVVSAPALRRSQRTIRAPVRYADQFL